MSAFVHGDNIASKQSHKTKYRDAASRRYLEEISVRYEKWKEANLALPGPAREKRETDEEIIAKRTLLFNEYKDFIDKKVYAEHFDSRSNLHSTALEEFMYYLFKDLVAGYSEDALIGKSHAFKDMFFRSDSFADMVRKSGVSIECKDHDFVIGSMVNASFQCRGADEIDREGLEIPAVAIECKTYLDKTMLEGAATACEQLKIRNPHAKYVIVAERLKLSDDVNLRKYKVDQVYVLRKEKNVDREYRLDGTYKGNPIYADVTSHLFNFVRDYLSTDWRDTFKVGLERGYLI